MSLSKLQKAAGAVVLALLAGLSVSAVGCKSTPVAEDGCKAIESARCRAMEGCPSLEMLDVEACVRFYDDQCLHGLASESDPGEPRIEQCVTNIDFWGACQKDDSDKIKCPDTKANYCAKLAAPEKEPVCDFLAPPAIVDAGVADTAVADTAADTAAE